MVRKGRWFLILRSESGVHANKGAAAALDSKASIGRVNNDSSASAGPGLDKERVLKVSWEKIAEDYTAEMLRDIFLQFDEVEDVVIKASRKRGSAIIVMATKDAAKDQLWCLSNPLLVLPLQPIVAREVPTTHVPAEPDRLSNLVGAGYQAYEDAVLKKLQKAAEKQNKFTYGNKYKAFLVRKETMTVYQLNGAGPFWDSM